ncbi:MAG: hypothetical protein WBB39_04030 [Candidatus Saccharimonadales bacterium]
MVKTVRRIGILLGIVVVLSQHQVLNALFALLFVGVIPMTTIVLPFWMMGLILGSVAAIALFWLLRQPVFIGDAPHQEKIAKSRARSHVLSVAAKQNQKTTTKPSPKRRTRKRYQTATSG